ncbi:PAS domain S-box [Halobacteroides halobius DSM 5150]|uniref:PAS domain S-box n=1 Tax=Halobacteroides halobius (strain ATCC 35273 / DSM 5150 / MD-1) TaxID=748449 RepID=L0KB30_HALHC|nr:sigma 54-interacting transcriptional regulator [Halobacteroides halobius]AGB41584.1 PAS domain S-box [Halobacteroides halobius DSM 5150]
MKEKKLVIITMSDATNKLFRQQLSQILKGQINIKGYSITSLTPDNIIEADLILTTKSLLNQIDNYIADTSNIIFARRALEVATLEKLIKLPHNKKTLLVNNTKLATLETKSLLKEVGIDHIELIPFYPGKDRKSIKDIDLAINLGEVKYIPSTINKVINIGSRILDLTTIVEILIRLDLLGAKANLLTSKQIRQLVNLSKRLNRNMKNLEEINKKLDTIINHVHDGIIYINQNQEIKVFNQMAEEIFGMKASEVIGSKIEETISNSNLTQVLDNDVKQLNALQNVGDKKIVTNRVPVKKDNKIIGALATFKDITEIKKLEQDLRRKLKNKGHIAKYSFDDIIGQSKEIKETIKQAKQLATSKSTILIQAESGTGKELFAQAIHSYSKRSKAPFVAVNCAALPEGLLESELFGYAKGAFTGAKKDGKPGVFEQAHTGTIFLDEIGDIPSSIQVQLLRVLQEKEVMRIGGTKIIPVDIRIIAATNKNLKQLVSENKLREDLYYRLNVLSLEIPPLRKRRKDIPLLIEFFLNKFSKTGLKISREVMSRLYNYNWQGNVRELENCIEFITQTCQQAVQIKDLPSYLRVEKNKAETEIREIKSKLESLGDIEEYIFILNELYLAKQLGEHIGRREIAKNAKISNLYLSAQMVRTRFNKLEELDLVKIGTGRQGTRITPRGVRILNQLNKLMG